jgi:hypothetical protein
MEGEREESATCLSTQCEHDAHKVWNTTLITMISFLRSGVPGRMGLDMCIVSTGRIFKRCCFVELSMI